MENARIVATGILFPEGPVVLPDGGLAVCEVGTGDVKRVDLKTGDMTTIASLGGSANGAAIGPDGALYVCNSGGFAFTDLGGMIIPNAAPHGRTQPDDYVGGSIQRVDLVTGEHTTLYTECGGHPLKGPNDLVFDTTGGFWFTDHGKVRERDEDRGGLYYALPDGSSIVEVAFGLMSPNGVGLSPAGDRLYVAETHTGRVWSWKLSGPGRIEPESPFNHGATLLAGLPGWQLLDSLAVEEDGSVCVATIGSGGITVISPDGATELVALPGEASDLIPTNICFGGDDRRTAYITLSSTGRLLECRWPRPGLDLAFPS